MDKLDKDIIIKRYQERLKAHGVGVKALSSGNAERQYIRFSHLCKIGDLENKKILDFGCGLSDFYDFIKNELKINVEYFGIDIVPEFIEISKQRYPECQFSEEDILESNFLETHKFDYIFCSQVFNNKYVSMDNMAFVEKVMGKLFSACNDGLALDFITDYVDFQEPHLNYYSPEKIYSLSKKLTKRVTLKSDYPLYEFMIFNYKDFTGWGKSKA
ncbi:MAG: class I SAM-dependent methyltransferase [Bacteriovorax sp.]|nr:class I SAM-dependent methyltransferase [Bacteriovorax sp.]